MMKPITTNEQKRKAASYTAKGSRAIGYVTEPKNPGDVGFDSGQTEWLVLFMKSDNDSHPIFTIKVSTKKSKVWRT